MRNQDLNKPAAPKPLSLPLNHEQRETLEKEADGIPISTYVKMRLFGQLKGTKDTRIRRPVKDQQALAQLLGMLGFSKVGENLNYIAEAIKANALVIDPNTVAIIEKACRDIEDMRSLLVRALGSRDQCHDPEGQ